MQTSQQDNTNVLFTAEVTKIIANSKYAKEECDGGKEINTDQMIACSLLLTPDMIHVIKIEEDAQECAYRSFSCCNWVPFDNKNLVLS